MVADRKTKQGHIYFIYSRSQDAVKVGFAVDWYTRLASLQSGNPAELTLSTAIPAQGDAERAFHAYMKPHRIGREWYPDDTLMFALRCELLELWADAVEEKVGRGVEWHAASDEDANPAGIFLTGEWMEWALPQIIDRLYDMDPEEVAEADLPPNKWAGRRRGRGRPVAPRLMLGMSVPLELSR